MAESEVTDGVVTLSPDAPVKIGSLGCWTLTFTAGEADLLPGTAVYMGVPHGFTPPQIDQPEAPGYVALANVPASLSVAVAVGTAPGDSLFTALQTDREMGILLFIERGPLRTGEHFQVVYGAGSGQAFVSSFAGDAPFQVFVCTNEAADLERFLPVEHAPVLSVLADALAQLEVIAPSGGTAGQSLELRVIGRDAFGNRCAGWAGWLKVETDVEGLLIPVSQRNEDTTGEGVELGVGLTSRLNGPLRVRVLESESGAEGTSNPVQVGERAPVWGDLHACLPEAKRGCPELDFDLRVGSMPTREKSSFYFQIAPSQETGTAAAASSGFLRFSLPDAHSDEMLPSHLLEIYSSWGNREYWGARRPDIRLDRHPDLTVRAVLAQGIVAGFAAGSNSRFGVGRDARRAEVGRGYPGGLTAVYTDSLEHSALFAALRERRCYATTGARILLQFEVNDYEMGRLVEVEEDSQLMVQERHIKARVYGTAPVDRIEVIRNNMEVCTYKGDGMDVAFSWADQQDLSKIALPRVLRGGGLTCYYYVRVIQTDGEIAWSSPIWLMLRQ